MLENDYYHPNGGPLRIIEVGAAQIGETEITGNQIAYYYGGKSPSNSSNRLATFSQRLGPSDSFTHTVQNSAGETAEATVFISVIERPAQ